MSKGDRLTAYSVSRRSSLANWELSSASEQEREFGYLDHSGERKCGHLALVPPERPVEVATLQEVLAELRSEDFERRLLRMSDGREIEFFASDPLISRLTAALNSSDARAVVESQLEELFLAHERGKVFEHTAVTMGLLYAIKAARMPGWDDIFDVFVQSRAAEFAPLRRFARSLLRR